MVFGRERTRRDGRSRHRSVTADTQDTDTLPGPTDARARSQLGRPAGDPFRFAAFNGGQPRRQARQSGSEGSCLEPAGAASRGYDPFRGGARPGSGGAQGMRLVRSGLLADAAVDPLAEQIGVAEVAGILLDHVEYHLAQRDGRAVLHRAADGEVG